MGLSSRRPDSRLLRYNPQSTNVSLVATPPPCTFDSGRASAACTTRSCPEADRSAPSLLLPRDVPAATHDRAELGCLASRLAFARLLNGGLPLETKSGIERCAAINCWTGL